MTSDNIAQQIPPKRILVVDDGPQLGKVFRMVLSTGGHTVEICPDAESALAKFDTGPWDLVITDLKLPRMNGLDLATAIKRRNATQPVMLITGHAEMIQWETEQVSKIDLLLEKPFSLQQLQDAIAKMFPPAQP
jgi:two-component system KDP operon response regulator KdpE